MKQLMVYREEFVRPRKAWMIRLLLLLPRELFYLRFQLSKRSVLLRYLRLRIASAGLFTLSKNLVIHPFEDGYDFLFAGRIYLRIALKEIECSDYEGA